MIQSLNRQGEVDDLVVNYGQVIVEGAHRLSAFSFERVLGLTATSIRKSGHHPIILMQRGPDH